MTYTSFVFRFSPPEMWIRQGLTLARTRPSLRNQRPVRSRRGSTSKSLIAPSSGTQSRIRAQVAAQIQADRSRRVILNDSAVRILALSTARSKLSLPFDPNRLVSRLVHDAPLRRAFRTPELPMFHRRGGHCDTLGGQGSPLCALGFESLHAVAAQASRHFRDLRVHPSGPPGKTRPLSDRSRAGSVPPRDLGAAALESRFLSTA